MTNSGAAWVKPGGLKRFSAKATNAQMEIPVGLEPTTPKLEKSCSVQLSYGTLVPSAGLEPATFGFGNQRSIRLIYKGIGSGEGIRTLDLQVMSLTSYRTAPPPLRCL